MTSKTKAKPFEKNEKVKHSYLANLIIVKLQEQESGVGRKGCKN